MTQAKLFDAFRIDDDQFLNTLEHETSRESVRSRADLVRSIENLMQYFDDDVKVREENLFEISSVKKSPRGKVAEALASLRSKCGLASALENAKTPTKVKNISNIQELKKKYENSLESESTLTPRGKSLKLKQNTKVEQLASLFSNSMIKSTPQTPACSTPNALDMTFCTTYKSTPKPKSPKMKLKYSTFKTNLSSPKTSPIVRRKLLTRTCNNSSLAETSLQDKAPLQKPSGTAHPLAANAFSQLVVKDKVLLYNKFIADLTKQNPKQAKALQSKVKKEIQRGEVVFEKQTPVKQLRDSFEAKLSPNQTVPITLPGAKKANSNLLGQVTAKSKEYEDITQNAQDLCSISTTSAAKKWRPKSRRQDVTFSENIAVLEQSQKRRQSMIRSSFSVEPLAPPKKIRRFRQHHLTPKTVFRNSHWENLFYEWLKEKDGGAFNMVEAVNKTDGIEVPAQAVPNNLETTVDNLQTSTNKAITHGGIGVIKQTLESGENCRENSVIEIELPLEDETPEVKLKPKEASVTGLTSTNKISSEDLQNNFKYPDISNSASKSLRRKKLRRMFPMKDEILATTPRPKVSSTESDSDYKTKTINTQSYSLPRALKPFNHNDKSNNSRIKTAFTLTVLSSPAAQSKIDYYDAKLASNHAKNVSRSCPSLFEAPLDGHKGFFHDKSMSEELTKFEQPKSLQEQNNLLIKSFTNQGFNIGTNDSPVRINIKTANKSAAENFLISYQVKARQQHYLERPDIEQVIPTTTALSQRALEDAPSLPVALERNNTPSSLSESSYSIQPFVPRRCSFNPTISQHREMSQFWISSDDFTAAITIHYHPAERLMLLNNIFAQKSWETKEVNFGIDDQPFGLLSNDTANEIIKQLAQRDNCSQYWFATGDVVLPFKGPQMATEKIQKFFNYIREFRQETESLRFGIDSYEFSKILQNSRTYSPWTVNASSPFKTSDLDQSELDSEECERSVSFSSLQEIWQKFATKGNTQESLKRTLQAVRTVKTTAL